MAALVLGPWTPKTEDIRQPDQKEKQKLEVHCSLRKYMESH